jgi:hypothetical protein
VSGDEHPVALENPGDIAARILIFNGRVHLANTTDVLYA